MKRCPAGDSDQEYFHHEGPGDVAGVKIASEQADRHEIYQKRQNGTYDHFVIYAMHLWEDVENFANDEGAKSDGYYIREGFMEEDYGA